MASLLATLNEVKRNFAFERKTIYEFEPNRKYRITFAKMFKTKLEIMCWLGWIVK